MRSVNNSSIETVNAAATAIVSAESRVQPSSSSAQKRRWGSCWSLYWCFGSHSSHKNSKRIGHAVLVPEPEVPGAVSSSTENPTQSTPILLPFIAPPSSPASFLQSDPSSSTQSPAGLLSLTSLTANAYSPRGPASIFAIGPYAHETQLVTPPVFSAFTTEPSTAPFTPPPESVQLTTPSSPEVPFAQLLTSSLERARRNSGPNLKFSLSHYEFQSYHQYPGSPGGQIISPGSAISNSGTSSPFPDRHPMLEFRMGEAPKLLGFEHFTTRKWGSRLGSGSLTPDGVGLGSRLGSGTATPDGMGLSRLGSGTATPDGMGLSRLGSGLARERLTPDCFVPASQVGFLLENQISEVASLTNSENGSKTDENVVHHRVSFELSGEEVARCLECKSAASTRTFPEYPHETMPKDPMRGDGLSMNGEHCLQNGEASSEMPEKNSEETEEDHSYRKQRSITLGSVKEFNFDNSKGEVSDKPEWWANETIAGKEARPANNWTFFPLLQPEVS
ncbi:HYDROXYPROLINE-RICH GLYCOPROTEIN-LIKE [Salix koriyanagi]|uniref:HYDROXYPROLINE-RICH GLYCOPROTEIN-LIKE n=1 Tax=Salix koriyanagi TaxID=2511006 RepID=A0A9Q1AAH6_9ROSI|nr:HYDROXYPROLINE-RICH GLYCOPROTEIN-LIKE [Salix koriyanagi]